MNGFRCECFSGFQGLDCSQDVDECESLPCANGAHCNNLVNGYTCTCLTGYTGNILIRVTVCVRSNSYVDECESLPCMNGAQCDNQGGISSSVLSVFFTDKFALSQSDARISGAYNSCQ